MARRKDRTKERQALALGALLMRRMEVLGKPYELVSIVDACEQEKRISREGDVCKLPCTPSEWMRVIAGVESIANDDPVVVDSPDVGFDRSWIADVGELAVAVEKGEALPPGLRYANLIAVIIDACEFGKPV